MDISMHTQDKNQPPFHKLNRSNKLKLRMGYKPSDHEAGEDYAFGGDYTSIRVPLCAVERMTKIKPTDKIEPNVIIEELFIKANTRVKLIPNCIVYPEKEFVVSVEANPILHEVANLSYTGLYGKSDIQKSPFIVAEFKKQFDLSKLDWLVELRLIG